MALPSKEVARETILEQGFLAWTDSAVGNSIHEVQKRGFSALLSEYGLDFCEQHVLNTRILSIVESFFDNQPCSLAHCLRYINYPGHILCFRKGGPAAGRRVLGVHLVARGSRIDYYRGSHLYDLHTTKGQRLLHEISPSSLVEMNCQHEEKEFPDGGLTIFDARIGFEIKEGFAIIYEFATVGVFENWAKMILPSSPELMDKVKDMERDMARRDFPQIRLNFGFRDPI